MAKRKIKQKVQVVIWLQQKEKGQVLLLRTNKKRGEFWQNVTGSVEKNETLVHAALREVEEETGLDLNLVVSVEKLPLIFSFNDRWGKDVVEHTFLLIVKKKFKVKISSKEHNKFMWKNIASINQKNYGFSTNFQTFLMATQC